MSGPAHAGGPHACSFQRPARDPARPGCVGGATYNRAVDGERRIELTVRVWRGGSRRQFERYINRLLKLLPRHGGRAVRRAGEVGAGPGQPDAVLVLSFPDTAAVDAYLSDPRRDDLEELAARAVTRSLITGGRTHNASEHDPVEVTDLPLKPD